MRYVWYKINIHMHGLYMGRIMRLVRRAVTYTH